MQTATYGVYRNGRIVLDEPVANAEESKVIVVFLDSAPNKSRLTDLFGLYGAWEDERDIETIISDIRNSRIFRESILL
jgi:hypothetical protein